MPRATAVTAPWLTAWANFRSGTNTAWAIHIRYQTSKGTAIGTVGYRNHSSKPRLASLTVTSLLISLSKTKNKQTYTPRQFVPRSEHTPHLSYRNQSANPVYSNYDCLLWDPYQTLCEKHVELWMLKLGLDKLATGLLRVHLEHSSFAVTLGDASPAQWPLSTCSTKINHNQVLQSDSVSYWYLKFRS